jgi:ribosomal protein S18 acetylase RimI-like enzyme
VGSLTGIVCHDLIGRCIPFMVIENVIVSKKSRRQGVGKRLMQEIEKIARASECRYIMLVSAVTREQAPVFYHSLGYAFAPYRGLKKILAP